MDETGVAIFWNNNKKKNNNNNNLLTVLLLHMLHTSKMLTRASLGGGTYAFL